MCMLWKWIWMLCVQSTPHVQDLKKKRGSRLRETRPIFQKRPSAKNCIERTVSSLSICLLPFISVRIRLLLACQRFGNVPSRKCFFCLSHACRIEATICYNFTTAPKTANESAHATKIAPTEGGGAEPCSPHTLPVRPSPPTPSLPLGWLG